MVQWLKLPPGVLTSHITFAVVTVLLQSSSLLMCQGKQQKMAQVLGALPPTQETPSDFLASALQSGPGWPLQALGYEPGDGRSLSLSSVTNFF